MLAAFEGWNDAGDAASSAARYLAERWVARPFASIEPEEFYDFSSTRPHVRLGDDGLRAIEWPANEFLAAPLPGQDRDIVVLLGVEPQLRWRTFAEQVVGVARALGAELFLSLGAMLADVVHTDPVPVIGSSNDRRLLTRHGLQPSRYEGPTGIVGVLTVAMAEAGIPAASLWATVPHYVHAIPSPKAALALVRRAVDLLDTPLRPDDLVAQASGYEREVDEIVEDDPDMGAYVDLLRRRTEAAQEEVGEADLPSGESLAAEFERYLREQGGS